MLHKCNLETIDFSFVFNITISGSPCICKLTNTKKRDWRSTNTIIIIGSFISGFGADIIWREVHRNLQLNWNDLPNNCRVIFILSSKVVFFSSLYAFFASLHFTSLWVMSVWMIMALSLPFYSSTVMNRSQLVNRTSLPVSCSLPKRIRCVIFFRILKSKRSRW